ncbi:hypothetical protein [Lysobacter sp. CA199]|uniref:hypothetical protein n=1 Tax=Lysobacter sp. CA199 TaxID=3455608 RepID=UPI003F8D61EA
MANTQRTASADPQDRRLFGWWAIAVASVFAGLMAGAWMLACNYAALGRRRAAWLTGVAAVLVVGPAGVYAMLMCFLLSLDYFGGDGGLACAAFLLAQPLLALAWAALAQGGAIKARLAAGLPMRSGWHAVAIVLAIWALAVLVCAVLWAAFGTYFLTGPD